MRFSTIPLLAVLALAVQPATAAPRPVKARAAQVTLTPDALLAQARAATQRGEMERALRLAQSAIVADPARPSSYVALGDIYAEAGQPDFARFYYQSALNIDPAEPGATRAIAALDDSRRSVLAKP